MSEKALILLAFVLVGVIEKDDPAPQGEDKAPIGMLENMCDNGEDDACEALADRLANPEQFGE